MKINKNVGRSPRANISRSKPAIGATLHIEKGSYQCGGNFDYNRFIAWFIEHNFLYQSVIICLIRLNIKRIIQNTIIIKVYLTYTCILAHSLCTWYRQYEPTNVPLWFNVSKSNDILVQIESDRVQCVAIMIASLFTADNLTQCWSLCFLHQLLQSVFMACSDLHLSHSPAKTSRI